MSTNLSPKVALLNFSATLGDNYKNVFNAIVNYANQTGKYRSNSVELLGKSYRISKAINTSDIEFNGTKLNLYLASFVPTFKDKSYVSKYNSNELSWQHPNVQTTIQVQPNVVVPTSNETQVSADADITKALEILKNAGLI